MASLLVCCGYRVLRGQKPSKQSFPHVLPCCSGVFWGMVLVLCLLLGLPSKFVSLGKHSCGPLCRPELTLAADLRPYLERQACCSQGWLSARSQEAGQFLQATGEAQCSESTGRHRINLFVNEIGLQTLVFQIYFGLQLYLNKAKEKLILALINCRTCWRCEMPEYGVGEARETQLFKKQVCSGYGSALLISDCLTHQTVLLLTPGKCVPGKKMYEIFLVLMSEQIEVTGCLSFGGVDFR